MGKKRSQKDRAYITATEWREEHGGHKGRLQGATAAFRRLPFQCCAISFQPFEDPVCTPDGTIMDIINAVPYIQKHKKHPVTGQPLELKDLVRLNFHKNTDGEYACPALGKVFNEHTHIVAIKPTGNVYCWDAVEQLCLKTKNMRDLITDEPFSRKDIIEIQDPMNLAGKNLAEFDHVKKELTAEDEEARQQRESDPMYGLKTLPDDAKRALAALGSEEAGAAFTAGGGGKKAQAERLLAEAKSKSSTGAGGAGNTVGTTNNNASTIGGGASGSDPRLRSAPREELKVTWKPGATTWNTDQPATTTTATNQKQQGNNNVANDKKIDASAGRSVPKPFSHVYTESVVTTGAASRSFTSTSAAVATRNERVKVLQQLKPTKKGYARIHTTLGDVNVELHCDIAPKTCENFLALAAGGYYDNTKFHRSIKKFMIQGGDPTGTGKGGVSVFGPTFEDELDSRMTHNERGILSMANGGPNTNGSQFFITYKSAHHLDFKHTVFGRVVGGFETLTAMERVPTDDEDVPLQEIEITGVTVFVNPYTDLIEEEKKKADVEEKKRLDKAAGRGGEERGSWFSAPAGKVDTSGTQGGGGVGKYLQLPSAAVAGGEQQPVVKKAKTGSASQKMSNFDAW